MAWEEEEMLKWEEGEQQRLKWGKEHNEQDEEVRMVEEREKEALILQGPESECESVHWGGMNGCSEGARTKNPEETEFLRDCDGGENSFLDFQDDGERTLDDNDEEEDGDEEEKKEEEEEERRGRLGSRSDSLHFFLEQLVDDEGWRECVEVTI